MLLQLTEVFNLKYYIEIARQYDKMCNLQNFISRRLCWKTWNIEKALKLELLKMWNRKKCNEESENLK